MARKFKRGYQPNEVVTEPKNEEATEKKEIKSNTIEIIPEPVIEVQPEEPEIIVGEEKPEAEAPKEVKFEFQEEYHLTHNGKDAVIDALPELENECVCVEPCACKDENAEPCVCVEPCVCTEENVVTETSKSTRPLASLSPAQLKAYQRTGFMPK